METLKEFTGYVDTRNAKQVKVLDDGRVEFVPIHSLIVYDDKYVIDGESVKVKVTVLDKKRR